MAAYNSTGFRVVNFTLDLHRELVFDEGAYNAYVKPLKTGNPERNKQFVHIKEIEQILKMLKLACYPIYASNGLVTPTIFFRFGQWTCKGYLENVTYEWKPPIIDDKYMVCSVSIGPINCSPKSVLEGSANYLQQENLTSLNPFGNSNDRSETALTQQGGVNVL